MSPAQPMVRGHVMQPLIALVRSLDVAIPESTQLVSGMVALMPHTWVEYSHFLATVYAAGARHQDFAFRAGYVGGKYQLAGTLSEIRMTARYDLRALAQGLATCFTGMGELRVQQLEPMHTVFVMSGEVPPAHLRYVTGWLTAALEDAGVRLTTPIVSRVLAGGGHTLSCAWRREVSTSSRGATVQLAAAV